MKSFALTTAVRASRKRTFSWRGGAAARFLAGVAAIALCAAPASAGTYTFDSTVSTGWNTTNLNWNNGSTDVAWPNLITDTAIFGNGGAGSTVTVIYPGGSTPVINVGTIQFNTSTSAYTIQSGPITLGTGIVNNDAAIGATISSVIAGTNGLAYSGTGTGTVTLGGANTYTGITTLSTSGTTLAMGNATGFGSTAGATASTLGTNYTLVNSGATAKPVTTAEAFLINGSGTSSSGALRIANSGTTLSSLIQLGSDSTIAGAFTTGNTYSGNIDLSAHTLTFSNTGGTISGQIVSTGGSGSVNFGSNSYTLTNNANSYAGTTTIGGGTYILGGDTVLGTSNFAMGSGTVESIDSGTRTIANAITGWGTLTFGAASTNTGALIFTNPAASNFGGVNKTLTTNVNTSFATAITGGTALMTKAGAATLTLSGASTWTGGVAVTAGTLAVNNTTLSGTGTGAVTISSGATLTGTGSASGTVSNSGTINPGAVGTVGTLTTGAETFNSGSILNLDYSGDTVDELITSSVSGLNIATLNFSNISGALVDPSYTLIADSAGGLTLPGTVTNLPTNYALALSGNNLNLVQIVAPAPEPSQYAAFGIGLLGLGGLALRARRRSLLVA